MLNHAAPPGDIDFILAKVKQLVPDLDFGNEEILLTGGTGFFGKWLSQSLIAMNERWSLNNRVHLLTRDPKKSLESSPWLNGRPDIHWIGGDVRKIESKIKFTTIIHGAAAASQTLNENQPDEMYGTIVDGTKQVLKLTEGGSCRRFQLVSSGAVYGRQPPELMNTPEDFKGEPDPANPSSAYGRAKRVAEAMVLNSQPRFQVTIPRCFAFIGPYLPLDLHFAAGNFLNHIVKNETIRIEGDGTPMRSYLYAADLIVWQLVALLSKNSPQVFNVGSGQALSIRELAEVMHKVGCEVKPERKNLTEPVVIKKTPKPGALPERYVPSVDLAKKSMGLEVWTDMPTAIAKTLKWI